MSWRLTPAGEEALRGKLSAPQRRALEDVRDHYDPAYRCVGRSMFGGLTAVMPVLNRNKWIEERPQTHCMRDPSVIGACAGPGKCSCECNTCLCPVCSINPCECPPREGDR